MKKYYAACILLLLVVFASLSLSSQTGEAVDPPQTHQKNVLINGDFQVWQNGTSYTNDAYDTTADRWVFASDTANLSSVVSRSSDSPDASLAYSWRIDANNVNTADNSAHVRYAVEGPDLRPLWDKTDTFSFWAKTNATGTYSIAFSNSNDRTYIGEYTVTTADTWNKYSVTLPMDTLSGGTWSFDPATLGIKIRFNFKVSSLGYATPNQWNNGNYTGASNTVNLWSSSSNYFELAGAQLYAGTADQAFVPETYATELAECMRYQVVFTKDQLDRTSPGSVTNATVTRLLLPVSVPLMKNTSGDPTNEPFLSIRGTRGTDWELRGENDVTNTTGTIDYSQTNSTNSPFIRIAGGSFTAGMPYHIILLTSTGRIRLNAELY